MAADSYSTSIMKPGDTDIYSAVMPTVELEEFDEGGDDRQNMYYNDNDDNGPKRVYLVVLVGRITFISLTPQKNTSAEHIFHVPIPVQHRTIFLHPQSCHALF